ncbi:MAG TPA: ATP-binding protein [Polyangiaceae bacterium]|nr:ATP-binding protein [Polyangiaceae bacterium]
MRKIPARGATDSARISKLEGKSDPAPVSNTEQSSSRPKMPDAVPVAWLDRLLVTVLDLPMSQGHQAIVETLVASIGSILPAYAVGVSLGADGGSGSRDPFVVRRVPDPGSAHSAASAPSMRLFPGFSHEYVASVPLGRSESTVHIASNDDDLDPATSPAVHLVDRAAMILARALPVARQALVAKAGADRSQRRLEERIIQAEKLATFGQLAAGLVHELNNPLTSIVAYSDYLFRKALEGAAPQDSEDIERLRRIHESANRMLRFTREFVSYARPSNEARGPVIVHDVLDQAIAFCEHVLKAAGVGVQRRYGPEVVAVRGVGEQLVQVFVNLLTNACQAAPKSNGRIVLTTSMGLLGGRRVVVVEVADNGEGIAPDHLPQVFEPFFTTKRASHGTGLGLSIVKSIVQAHDGEVRAFSEQGRGTQFVVELPANDQPIDSKVGHGVDR